MTEPERRFVVESVSYAADDARLEGLAYRPIDAGTRGLGVVVLHGGATTKSMLLSEDYLCQALARRGYSVLSGHFRGPTGSDDRDAIAAIDWVATSMAVDPNRIGLAGHSRGGFVAQRIACREPRIRSIVSLASGTDMVDVDVRLKVHSMSQFVGVFAGGGGTVEANARRRASLGPTDEELRSIRVPILWIQGTRDLYCPPESSIKAHAMVLAAGNERAELSLIDGMDHFWGHPSGPMHGRVAAQVADWFDRTL